MNGMPFHRRKMLSPIVSNKNIVNQLLGPLANTTTLVTIAQAVDGAVLANQDEVERACKINQIYMEVWIYGVAVSGVNSRISWGIFKNPGNNLTFPSMSLAGTSDNKRHIFAQGSGLVGNSSDGQPGYLIRGWFKVPKGMRRMGAQDTFILSIRNDTANPLNVCALFIYKWYT